MAEGKKYIRVVGAVVERNSEILCAQRGGRGSLAGLWEFPGGKIEPEESPREALAREIDEELMCDVVVGGELTTTVHEYDFATIELTTFWCRLTGREPTLTEHSEVRWLPPTALGELDWAPADVPAVELIQSRNVPS